MQLCFSAKHPPSPHPVYESKNENKKTQIGEEMLTNAIIYLVNIVKLGLVKILTLDLVEMLIFGWDFEVNA